MNLFPKFAEALPLSTFLEKHGTLTDRPRWQRALEATTVTDEQRSLLGKFTRETNILLLAGAWCGDCVAQCPIFEKFAEVAPVLKVRYLDRDAHRDVQDELRINGGDRVPVAVFFSEDGFEVSRYGERTLTKYRQLAAQLGGETCGTGIVKGADPVQLGIVQDWLNEVERVQWMLRLSPRLRRVHGD